MTTLVCPTAEISVTAYPATLTITPVVVEGGGGGGTGFQAARAEAAFMRAIKDDDLVIMRVIETWLRKAA